LRFGKSTAIILLNILHIPFACTSSSFFNGHDLQVWSFDEFLHITFEAFQSSKSSSVFSFMPILSSRPEILSSACSSLLKWLSGIFFYLI
jgi:hypothetical protein